MIKPKFTVGGEFVFSPGLFLKPDLHQFSDYGRNLTEYHRHYTFGAYYSLKAMIADLKLQAGEYILLPSYLCPTVIRPFREAGVRNEFYKLKEGLKPDLEDIDRKSGNGLKAVLFIDYFGFPQKDFVEELVCQLRRRGVTILQNTVQSWLNNEAVLYGDYCFNSLRKYTPFEAGVILSRKPMRFKTSLRLILPFLFQKRAAQAIRFLHLELGLFSPQSFLNLLDKANACYHQPGVQGLPRINRMMLNKIDFRSWGRQRRTVYNTLNSSLSPRLIINSDLDDIVPLGMAVYLRDRNARKQALHRQGIHCPLHWLLADEIDKKEHEYAWDLQDHALTLPLNVSANDMGTYINILKKVLN